ncbi:MAG TPA: hypothetical protein VK020_07355 [Microlunatus sp.]|nr:hypothetical protein [Microlunatus sp.]
METTSRSRARGRPTGPARPGAPAGPTPGDPVRAEAIAAGLQLVLPLPTRRTERPRPARGEDLDVDTVLRALDAALDRPVGSGSAGPDR